ncbi:hypothetical protein [Loigolactobacillus jiayinensis]|uniref:Uncharacterized protein n=1 Tax=Loigolactobacillus jiayinensis TaxID=2486016 RepID=A0ABW1R953_9LACO|nr:hypothetical protein [Loigolactobacillus jiayinensis]
MSKDEQKHVQADSDTEVKNKAERKLSRVQQAELNIQRYAEAGPTTVITNEQELSALWAAKDEA